MSRAETVLQYPFPTRLCERQNPCFWWDTGMPSWPLGQGCVPKCRSAGCLWRKWCVLLSSLSPSCYWGWGLAVEGSQSWVTQMRGIPGASRSLTREGAGSPRPLSRLWRVSSRLHVIDRLPWPSYRAPGFFVTTAESES